MIEVIEEIIGIEMGTTAYDDIIVSGALILGMTCIILFIHICKSVFTIFR